jgi:hypothetical protein
MSEIGIDPIAGVPFGGGAVIRNPPTVTVLQPVAVVSAQTPTIQWQYLSPIPRAQTAYRIRLLSQDGSAVLFDTFETPVSPAPPEFTTLTSDTFQVVLPFILSNGNIYQVEVSASDGFDFSLPVTATFAAALATVGDIPDVLSVGSVYEIGINGQGFMLADRPERPVRRRSILLEPPRLATTDTPFTEAVERYTMIGYSNFVSGAGQRRLDRSRSVDDRYWQSEGVDPFEDGELRLLPDTEREVVTTYANPLTVVADEELYVLTGAKQFTNVDEPGDTPVVFSVAAAGTVKSVTSDGLFWYATDGSNIYRNDTAADPSSAWSTVDADLIVWCSDRIVAVEDDSGDAIFTTLAPDGTEEVAGGRFKFEDATITSVVAGDGYVWFSVDRAGVSEVRAWQLGGAPESVSFTAFTLPAGETVTGLGFYLGNVFIRASCGCVAGGERAILYRAIPSEGVLNAQRVTGIAGSGLDQGSGVWGGNDRYAFFSWKQMVDADRSGVGAIDLASGGWAKWLAASDTGADGAVSSIVSWRGRPTFTVVGAGVYTTINDPVPSGWLRTSHTDLGSSLSKIVDDIRVVFELLPGSSSVTVLLSLDNGNSYVQQGATVGLAGSKEVTYQVGRATATVGLEIRLTAAGGVSPVLSLAQVRVHPLSLRDELVVLPINCADTLSGLNGQVLPESGPGRGMQRIRFLENLISTRVKFQDVDWPRTKQSSIWEVVDIDTSGPGIYETRQNRRTDSAVATITLRRPS